jgi:hypothetical protein
MEMMAEVVHLLALFTVNNLPNQKIMEEEAMVEKILVKIVFLQDQQIDLMKKLFCLIIDPLLLKKFDRN